MAGISVLVQNSALTPEAKASKIGRLEDDLIALFMAKFNANRDEVIVRQAEPDTDLGFTDTQQITGALVADTETDYVNRDITNIQTVVGFFAITNLSANPSVNRVRFKVGVSPGTGVKVSVYLEALYSAQEIKGWLEQPAIYVSERMLVRVEAFQTVAAPGERLVLEGLVAEKAGNVITQLEEPVASALVARR